MYDISVLICSHNPRADYLRRTLNALRSQSLPKEKWELLLIDNASKKLLSDSWDLSWHPEARIIREEAVGLTAARLKGISASQSNVLVFVDDDNVLDADYLEQAWRIGEEKPFIGAWGGALVAEHEQEPPAWAVPFLPRLAIYDVPEDHWGNLPLENQIAPAGGGMCLRREVAEEYVRQIARNPDSRMLDRSGGGLMGHGDRHLAHCSFAVGYGTGRFADLRLTHLIDERRVSLGYLLKQAEGNAYSSIMFRSILGAEVKKIPNTHVHRLVRRLRAARAGLSREQRAILEADISGHNRAVQEVERGRARS